MNRGEITEIQNLSPGDRYYVYGGQKTAVYEVVDHVTKGFIKAIVSTIVFHRDTKKRSWVKPGKQVVFLRNINDNAQ